MSLLNCLSRYLPDDFLPFRLATVSGLSHANNLFFFFCSAHINRQKSRAKSKRSPLNTEEGRPSRNSHSPLDVSSDYILFSPTHLAAARERAEIQRSLRNQSVSVLTPPTGLELSTLNDTLPQPGKAGVLCFLS